MCAGQQTSATRCKRTAPAAGYARRKQQLALPNALGALPHRWRQRSGESSGMTTEEHQIMARVSALFRRRPALCGFAVRHTDQLVVSEVTVHPPRGRHAPAELAIEIVATLGELIDECPEACELLRVRTFARTLH